MTQSRITIGPLLHEESIFGANGSALPEDVQSERFYFLGYEVDFPKRRWVRCVLTCIDSTSGKKCWETTLGATEVIGMFVDDIEHMVYVLDSQTPEDYDDEVLLDFNRSRYLIGIDGITGIIKQRIEIPGFAGSPRIDYHARILWMCGLGQKYWRYHIPTATLEDIPWLYWPIEDIEYIPAVGKTFVITSKEILEEVGGTYDEKIHQESHKIYSGRSQNGIYFRKDGIQKFFAKKMQVEEVPILLGTKDPWEVNEENGDMSEEEGKKYLTAWRMLGDPMHVTQTWKREVPMMSRSFLRYDAKTHLLFIMENEKTYEQGRGFVPHYGIAIYDIASQTGEDAFIRRIPTLRDPQVFMTVKGKLVIHETDYFGGTLSMYDVHQAQS